MKILKSGSICFFFQFLFFSLFFSLNFRYLGFTINSKLVIVFINKLEFSVLNVRML